MMMIMIMIIIIIMTRLFRNFLLSHYYLHRTQVFISLEFPSGRLCHFLF